MQSIALYIQLPYTVHKDIAQKLFCVKSATKRPPSAPTNPEPVCTQNSWWSSQGGMGSGHSSKSLPASTSASHSLKGPLRPAPAASEFSDSVNQNLNTALGAQKAVIKPHCRRQSEDKKKSERVQEDTINITNWKEKRLLEKGLIKINLAVKKSNWITVDLFIWNKQSSFQKKPGMAIFCSREEVKLEWI